MAGKRQGLRTHRGKSVRYVRSPWGGIIRSDRTVRFTPAKGQHWGAYPKARDKIPIIASTNKEYVKSYAKQHGYVVRKYKLTAADRGRS